MINVDIVIGYTKKWRRKGSSLLPRTYVKAEYFQYIEQRGSVSVAEFALKFGLKKRSAATWLSNWVRRGYLKHVNSPDYLKPVRLAGELGRPEGSHGVYTMGEKWWGELIYSRDTM